MIIAIKARNFLPPNQQKLSAIHAPQKKNGGGGAGGGWGKKPRETTSNMYPATPFPRSNSGKRREGRERRAKRKRWWNRDSNQEPEKALLPLSFVGNLFKPQITVRQNPVQFTRPRQSRTPNDTRTVVNTSYDSILGRPTSVVRRYDPAHVIVRTPARTAFTTTTGQRTKDSHLPATASSPPPPLPPSTHCADRHYRALMIKDRSS